MSLLERLTSFFNNPSLSKQKPIRISDNLKKYSEIANNIYDWETQVDTMTPNNPWHLNFRTYMASVKPEVRLEIFAQDLSIQDKISRKHKKPSNEYDKYSPFINHLREKIYEINNKAAEVYLKTLFPEDLKIKF